MEHDYPVINCDVLVIGGGSAGAMAAIRAKEMNPEGVTTEFIRCPDPTDSGIVVKIVRTPLTG